MKLSIKLKWALLWLGKAWAEKLIPALTSVDPDDVTDLKTAKEKLCYAVQHCDPDSGALRVSGELRGLICTAINAASDMKTLAAAVIGAVQLLEKYAA